MTFKNSLTVRKGACVRPPAFLLHPTGLWIIKAENTCPQDGARLEKRSPSSPLARSLALPWFSPFRRFFLRAVFLCENQRESYSQREQYAFVVLKNVLLLSRVFANAARKFVTLVTLKCKHVSQVSCENSVIFICNSTRHSSKYSSILRHSVSSKLKSDRQKRRFFIIAKGKFDIELTNRTRYLIDCSKNR